MSKITFECPDDILQTLSETPERFAEKGRLLIAIKLFELGRLSSGQAARFADMDRVRVGMLERLKMSCAVPYSTTLPRYMTAIWSHIWETTPRLWVIRTIEDSNSSRRRFMRSRI